MRIGGRTTITTAMTVGALTVALTGCSGGSTDSSTAASQPSTAGDRTVRVDVDPGNPAAEFNAAWAELAAAQKAYDAVGANTDITDVSRAWMDDVQDREQGLRDALTAMQQAAKTVPFPDTFTTKGEISQGTADEYLDAYDAFLSLQEDNTQSAIDCVDGGGDLTECVMVNGVELMANEKYLAAYDRVKAATVAIYEEANQPPN